jgi:hypothetical protein
MLLLEHIGLGEKAFSGSITKSQAYLQAYLRRAMGSSLVELV